MFCSFNIYNKNSQGFYPSRILFLASWHGMKNRRVNFVRFINSINIVILYTTYFLIAYSPFLFELNIIGSEWESCYSFFVVKIVQGVAIPSECSGVGDVLLSNNDCTLPTTRRKSPSSRMDSLSRGVNE